MKILLHDYCGHPFQYQLAKELAARGHSIEHVYCGSIPTTPQGVDGAGGRDDFRSRAISLPKPISKGAFLERFLLERRYGRELARVIEDIRPEVAVMANTPVDSLAQAARSAYRIGAASVIWVQDLLGEAALRILPQRIGVLGKLIGQAYRYREERLLLGAQHLVSITDDFGSIFHRAGVPDADWTTIPNWAPLDKLGPRDKINDWSLEQGIQSKTVFLYSGTLGFKHNPRLLLSLAKSLQAREDAVVVVNSEGAAADWLKIEAERNGLGKRLRVNGFQAFERMSEVLGSADVLLAILEPDAGAFSVPSKVLSNLCAGRPQVLAVPAQNLAARIVQECTSGLVCDPHNENEFVAAALLLLDDIDMRRSMGKNAWDYALKNFQIERIAERFETVFEAAIHNLCRRRGEVP